MLGSIAKGSVIVSVAFMAGCATMRGCSNSYKIKKLEEKVAEKSVIVENESTGLLRRVWESVPDDKKKEIIRDEMGSFFQADYTSPAEIIKNLYADSKDNIGDIYKNIGGGVK